MANPLDNIVGSKVGRSQIVPLPNIEVLASESFNLDLSYNYLVGGLGIQRSIYIDNSTNNTVIRATSPTTGQSIVIGPFQSGWFPFFMPAPLKVKLEAFPVRQQISSAILQLALCDEIISQGPIEADTLPALTAQAISAGGTTTLVPGIANQTIRVHQFLIVATSAVNVNLASDAPEIFTGPMHLEPGIPINLQFSERPYFTTTPGANFQIVLSAAALVNGLFHYEQSA